MQHTSTLPLNRTATSSTQHTPALPGVTVRTNASRARALKSQTLRGRMCGAWAPHIRAGIAVHTRTPHIRAGIAMRALAGMLALALCVPLAACAGSEAATASDGTAGTSATGGITATPGASTTGTANSATAAVSTIASGQDNYDFSLTTRDEDASYDAAAATSINFTAANQTETITQEGTYIISGSSEGGQLVVDLSGAPDPENAKVQLVLNGLSLSNTKAPALLIAQADKVFLTLAPGSTNSLSDGSGRTDLSSTGNSSTGSTSTGNSSTGNTSASASSNADTDTSEENATLYSHDDLTINGTGSLSISSAAHHGIKCQDDLVIAGGTLTVKAGADGIRGKDSLKIAGGTLTIKAGDDGLVSTQDNAPYEKGFISITGGTITIEAADDGVKGASLVRLAGGSVTVASSYEGIEACQVWIEGGQHSITSSDDGLNAAGSIRTDNLLAISGGTVFVNAEGDGLDSNNLITQSGGTVVVAGPTRSGNGAVDADRSATTTGGTLLALDSSGMSMTYGTGSTQGSLLYAPGTLQQGGTRISLVDSAGNVLFSYLAPKQWNVLAYSSPKLVVGESYQFVVGGELSGGELLGGELSGGTAGSTLAGATATGGTGSVPSGGAAAGGLFTGGTLSGGQTLTSFTLSQQIAQINAGGTVSAYSGQGMMGGGMGGMGGGRGGDAGPGGRVR